MTPSSRISSSIAFSSVPVIFSHDSASAVGVQFQDGGQLQI